MSYSNNRNWEIRELSDVFWFQEGPGVRNWQFTRSGIKLLNVANISQYGTIDLDKTDRYLSEQEVKTKYKHFLVDEGDLVIASSGISFDEDGLLRTRGAFVRKEHLPLCMNTSTIRFKGKEGLSDLHFLRFWLDSFEFRDQITRLVTGSAQQNFGPSHLKSTYITLPPITEQKRIATILEKADHLRRQRRYVLELSNTYLQSVFLEMFGDPVTNPKGWNRVPISELGTVQTGNTPSREVLENYGDYLEWIKSDNIIEGLLYITKSKEQLSELGARQGRIIEPISLLITCIAGSPTTIGNVALTNRRVAFNQQINAITPYKEINPFFLYGMFLVAKPLIQHSTTLGMKRIITKSKLENLYLVKPPKELQEQFATIVQCIERIRTQQREAERQAEHLFQTLLHQAFEEKVGLGSGMVQDEVVEQSVQPPVVRSELTGSYVQLRMKY